MMSVEIFFLKFWCRALKIFVIGQKWVPEKWGEGLKNLPKPELLN